MSGHMTSSRWEAQREPDCREKKGNKQAETRRDKGRSPDDFLVPGSRGLATFSCLALVCLYDIPYLLKVAQVGFCYLLLNSPIWIRSSFLELTLKLYSDPAEYSDWWMMSVKGTGWGGWGICAKYLPFLISHFLKWCSVLKFLLFFLGNS